MEIINLPDKQSVIEALHNDEPMISAIGTDGQTAILAPLDYGFEHHILISQAGYKETDIDKFFRIIFDKSGADWTFVCPPDYKNISPESYMINIFYKDGLSEIEEFLTMVGYCISINIHRDIKDISIWYPVKKPSETRG